MTPLRDDLLPVAALVTPNLPEAEALTGLAIGDRAAMLEAARRIPARAVLLKGGHAPQPWLGQDWLWDGTGWQAMPQKPQWPTSPRGTGCRLATALAIGLGRRQPLLQACTAATRWLDQWYYGL